MSPSSADEQAALLQALGLLVVNFSALEDALRDAIFIAAGDDSVVVSILTAGMGFRALVDKFGAVCVTLRPPLASREDMKKLCNTLDVINSDRNALIHSAWSTTGPAGVPRRHKVSADAGKGLRLNPHDVPIPEIHALVSRIEDADQKIFELVVPRTTV